MHKVAIVGCGGIFEMHAVSLSKLDNIELVCVCDIREERAIVKAQKYNCRYYTDYKTMLNSEEIDCVHICTPHYLHYPMTKYALKKKVNVVCEKPMALLYAEAEELSLLANENGVRLAVVFQNRYNPGSVLANSVLKSTDMGTVVSAKIVLTWDRGLDYYQQSDWKGTLKYEGGGVIIDQAIHSLDLLCWLIDQELTFVNATCSNRLHEGIEVEDEAIGVFYLGEIPVIFYTINYYSLDSPVEIQIHCTNGCVNIIGESGKVKFNNGTTITSEPTEDDYIDFGDGAKEYWGTSHYKLIKDFYENDCHNEWNKSKHYGFLRTQLLVESIYSSSKMTKPITFGNDEHRRHEITYDLDNT